MKKLILTFGAIGLFFAVSTQAQVYANSSSEVPFVEVLEKSDYEKIEVSELPAAITTSVSTDFEEATITEAWVKEKEDGTSVYKIKLDVNGEEKKLYADAEGNWIDSDEETKES